jgi:2-polyprenyl-6-methoxyphenol hydroxylase-like FAD-dependent oxidoreductase
MGQGAAMALASAWTLADGLDPNNLRASLAAHEARGAARTAWITKQSLSMGRIDQLENAILRWARNAATTSCQ